MWRTFSTVGGQSGPELGYRSCMARRRNPLPQTVRFCRSADGVRIAYARYGQGPPLVISTCWLSHLEYDLESPVWRHFVEDLGEVATLIRFDERGHGLSDWQVPDFSFESRIADLEAVVEAAGFDRFALLGMAQGGPVSIAYAHRHPERVSRLILHGSGAATLDGSPGFRATRRDLHQDDRGGLGTSRRAGSGGFSPTC